VPYAEGRIFHDADSHLMETQDWLVSYADPQIRERLLPPNFNASGRMAEAIGKKRDAGHWAAVNIEANLMNLKGWEAFGASDPQERTRALDMLGFHRQLIFPSIAMSQFWGMFGQCERDLEVLYGGARALNRAMTDFRETTCSCSPRTIPILKGDAIRSSVLSYRCQASAKPPRSASTPIILSIW
jgi:hypothetical protein